MILESFSHYLQAADVNLPASCVLARWLYERLSLPPETLVDRVLHCELAIDKENQGPPGLRLAADTDGPYYMFKPNSPSGSKLLHSLHQYSLSYEQQKWSRFVHGVKASDFNQRSNQQL